ncbi:MAG: nuclease A inhibitor family protein [Saprospiraceae bacterium]|nr:nuclease A inhibitor family protein [Saprospiraceae bacterium]
MTLRNLMEQLDQLAETLKSAGGKDKQLSRKDFRALIDATHSPAQAHLMEIFYSFLWKLEARPRMRVTHEVIDNGVAFIKEQILPEFEIAEVFSTRTEQTIAQVHPSAWPMANQLVRATEEDLYLTAKQVAGRISKLTEGLFFDDFGSEGSEKIEAFYLDANMEELLTEASFASALNLNLDNPLEKIERFVEIGDTLDVFVEQHVRFGRDQQAASIVQLMEENLLDIRVIILGEDYNPAVPADHPTYVVGLGKNGDLAGFKTQVIWT